MRRDSWRRHGTAPQQRWFKKSRLSISAQILAVVPWRPAGIEIVFSHARRPRAIATMASVVMHAAMQRAVIPNIVQGTSIIR